MRASMRKLESLAGERLGTVALAMFVAGAVLAGYALVGGAGG
jgi:hypothetical protein